MRAANCSVASIADKLKRPIEGVYGVCKRLVRAGVLGSKRGRAWTMQDLTALGNPSLRDEELAELLHRTTAAVKKKRLGLSLRPRIREGWSPSQHALLIELRAKGASFGEIAIATQRSVSAVSNRVSGLIRRGRLLALPNAERSRRGALSFAKKREDRWTETEKDTVRSLWKTGHTAIEISATSKRSLSSIQNFLGIEVRRGAIEHLSEAAVRTRLVRARQRKRAERCIAADALVEALPNTMTAGYIIGVLYGDGFISGRRYSGSIGLKSTNESFCRAFADALQETFGRKIRLLSRIEPIKRIGNYEYKDVRYYEAFLHSTHLASALQKVFGYTDEFRWRANPDYVMQIGERFADGVVQGFFDAEGSFMRNKEGRHYATACSMNGKGLESIREILKRRGYNTRINVDLRGQWKIALNIQSEVLRFATEIGSRIAYKRARMQRSIQAKMAKS
jgi:hypothetical protein